MSGLTLEVVVCEWAYLEVRGGFFLEEVVCGWLLEVTQPLN